MWRNQSGDISLRKTLSIICGSDITLRLIDRDIRHTPFMGVLGVSQGAFLKEPI